MIPSIFGNTAFGWVATLIFLASVYALVTFFAPVAWVLGWVAGW